jgi:hypothetical protein
MCKLLFLLEFPQNLIGYIGYLYFTKIKRSTHYYYKDATVIRVAGVWGAVSLSKYIFADDNHYMNDVVKHEYGHTLQSKRLLLLYLLVIGLPSIIWAGCFEKYRQQNGKSYYWFYTEAWANKLGGVDLK